MAAAQLTASSVSVSARNLSSFEGLRPSSVKFASFGTLKASGVSQRSFRGLAVKAATLVAPKVTKSLIHCLVQLIYWGIWIIICWILVSVCAFSLGLYWVIQIWNWSELISALPCFRTWITFWVLSYNSNALNSLFGVCIHFSPIWCMTYLMLVHLAFI